MKKHTSFKVYNVEAARKIQEADSDMRATCKRLGLSYGKHVEIKKENLYPLDGQLITILVSNKLSRRIEAEREKNFHPTFEKYEPEPPYEG